MKSVHDMSQAELAAYIQSHLHEKRIDVVLSGGAAVAIYTQGEYVSPDLDLVNRYFAARPALVQAMKEIGFTEIDRHFIHPQTHFLVEFPPGPLALGDERIEDIEETQLETSLLRVIRRPIA